MPEPMYGISREQYRTDVPPAGPSSTLPRPSVNPAAVLGIAILGGLMIAWLSGVSTVFAPVAPMPTPPSREASLERQVGALSTRVVELEWRNASTLAALDSFERSEPTPTPTYIYVGPGESRPR